MLKTLLDTTTQALQLQENKDLILAFGALISSGYFFLKGRYTKDNEQIMEEFYINLTKKYIISSLPISTHIAMTGRAFFEKSHPELIPKNKPEWLIRDVEYSNMESLANARNENIAFGRMGYCFESEL